MSPFLVWGKVSCNFLHKLIHYVTMKLPLEKLKQQPKLTWTYFFTYMFQSFLKRRTCGVFHFFRISKHFLTIFKYLREHSIITSRLGGGGSLHFSWCSVTQREGGRVVLFSQRDVTISRLLTSFFSNISRFCIFQFNVVTVLRRFSFHWLLLLM